MRCVRQEIMTHVKIYLFACERTLGFRDLETPAFKIIIDYYRIAQVEWHQ